MPPSVWFGALIELFDPWITVCVNGAGALVELRLRPSPGGLDASVSWTVRGCSATDVLDVEPWESRAVRISSR